MESVNLTDQLLPCEETLPTWRNNINFATVGGSSTSINVLAHSDAAGAQLDAIRRKLFRSAVFAKYLRIVTALDPIGYKDEVTRFRSGLDYTVAHYGVLTKVSRLDAPLCFVNEDLELQERIMNEHNGVPAPAASKADTKQAAQAAKAAASAAAAEAANSAKKSLKTAAGKSAAGE